MWKGALVGGQEYNTFFSQNLNENIQFSSLRREIMPLILISKMPVTAHANQQQKYQGDQKWW